jgi:F1F0 ATPase subunit 2
MDAEAMMGFHLTEHASLVLQAGAWLGTGALIGAFYFLSLHWNVRMLAFGRPLPLVLALQLGRYALVAGVLAAIASRFGALPLLLAAAGILAARAAAVRFGEQT